MQKPNLKKLLTKASFNLNDDINDSQEPGIFNCKDMICKICSSNYIQPCKSFKTANNDIWFVKSHIICNSTNVLYYLTCNMCEKVTYNGKTHPKLRLHTINHITCCANGTSTNIFDNQVINAE